MTENGNHGGSSYEETDSLALFIGLKSDKSDIASASDNFVYQVCALFLYILNALISRARTAIETFFFQTF